MLAKSLIKIYYNFIFLLNYLFNNVNELIVINYCNNYNNL